MFFVLILVPAILGIQADWGRQRRAFRRVLRGRTGMGRMRGVVLGAAGLMAVAFGATMGWVLAFGALPGGLVAVVPVLGAVPAGVAALLLFLTAAAVILGVALIAGRLVLRPYTARSSSATP